jgi:hypothetical protein
MDEQTGNWGFDDFLLFILIYAAFADLKITDDEKGLIIAKYGEGRFNEMLSLFKNNTDFDNFMILHEFKDNFLEDNENLDKVMKSVQEIFYADGDFSVNEKNVEIAIKSILDS